MTDSTKTSELQKFWADRYQNANTGWDIGYPSTPLKTYFDQIENKDIKILFPGAGNAYEAEYLFKNGFSNVYVLDIAESPLQAFQKRIPDFPSSQLIQGNFFEQEGQYDLIIEQTFFCSFPPTTENRQLYGQKMATLLKTYGKLVGLWFDFPLTEDLEKRPFGGTKAAYLSYLMPYFEVHIFETAYNSIPPRKGKELFGIFQVRNGK